MVLLRKDWRARHCGITLRYDTRREANAARAKLIQGSRHTRRPIPAFQAYHCRRCWYWHLDGTHA